MWHDDLYERRGTALVFPDWVACLSVTSMSENSLALTIGGEVKVVGMGVGGKLFVFSANQQSFLMNLQKLKSVHAAALAVGKDEIWGQKFLKSQKFRKYLNLKLQAFSDRNGLDVDWWYAFGKKLAEGVEEVYSAHCPGCELDWEMSAYEAESARTDDMELKAECPACMHSPVSLLKVSKTFSPTREQVEGWKELGSRLIPKVERVNHSFEKSEYIFESEGA